jgi:hypothetical protein
MRDGSLIDANFSTLVGAGGYSTTNNITARAGGGQATATVLTACLNRVTTVGSAADSVALPAAVGGQCITVINASGTSMQVFAAVGSSDTINGTAGSTGVAIAGGKTMEFISFPAVWHGLLSA